MTAEAKALLAVGASALLALVPAAAAAQTTELAAPAPRYVQAVHAAVTANWLRPESDRAGLSCVVEIQQRPGGDVVQVSFGQPCNADAASRDAIQRAVTGASPLPYAGFESEFRPRIRLVFQYDGH